MSRPRRGLQWAVAWLPRADLYVEVVGPFRSSGRAKDAADAINDACEELGDGVESPAEAVPMIDLATALAKIRGEV